MQKEVTERMKFSDFEKPELIRSYCDRDPFTLWHARAGQELIYCSDDMRKFLFLHLLSGSTRSNFAPSRMPFEYAAHHIVIYKP